jgi:DNA polymerase-3 subunit gamma/tau
MVNEISLPEGEYQALYRRFRPQKFKDLIGQRHVTMAMTHAVSEGKVAHAYLFSGPRGTGKTSCARILAKALNCTSSVAGEPCDECPTCVAIREGSSLDVYELDAASNNGVDAIRDLVSKTALATPGRWKVYIIDEIHMLSTAASNALLKTLEEPPAHVVFVLATTDPQKVIPTIRSRTQHYEFRLITSEDLEDLLSSISHRAEISLPTGAITAATKKGRGSARDALSALEQIAIVGQVEDDDEYVENIVEALASRNSAQAMVEVARAVSSGLDPAQLAIEIADYLRQGFLASLAPQLVVSSGSGLERYSNISREMGLPALVRTMEMLGEALVYMRDSLDSRVQLESVLMKSCMLPVGDSYADLVERIEHLERLVASGLNNPAVGGGHVEATQNERNGGGVKSSGRRHDGEYSTGGQGMSSGGTSRDSSASKDSGGGHDDGVSSAGQGSASKDSGGKGDASKDSGGGHDGNASSASKDSSGGMKTTSPRQALGAYKRTSPAGGGGQEDTDARSATDGNIAGEEDILPATVHTEPAAASEEAGGKEFNRDLLVVAWGDAILSTLSPRAKSRYAPSRFVAVNGHTAVMALPNDTHMQICKQNSKEVEDAISSYFGIPVKIELIVERAKEHEPPASGSPSRPPSGPSTDRSLVDASSSDGPPAEKSLHTDDSLQASHIAPGRRSAEEHIRETFPGVEEL